MSGKITLLNPQGRRVEVSAEDAGLLRKLGYREETAEETVSRASAVAEEERYSGVGSKIAAFGEGALSSATLGLTDVAFADEDTRRRAQYNPGARVAGEIVGGIGAAVAVPFSPAGLAAKGGSKIAGKLGGGAIGKTVGVGVEGAAQSAGQVASFAALNDDPLTAEALIGGVGLGFFIGAGSGLLSHGISRVADKARAGLITKEAGDVTKDAGSGIDEFRAAQAKQNLADADRARDIERRLKDLKTERAAAGSQTIDDLVPEDAYAEFRGAVDDARKDLGTINRTAREALESVRAGKGYSAVVDDVEAEARRVVGPSASPKQYLRAAESAGAEVMGGVSLLDPAQQKALGPQIVRLRKAYKALSEGGDGAAHAKALDDLSKAAGVPYSPLPKQANDAATASLTDGVKNLRSIAKEIDAATDAVLEGKDGASALARAAAGRFHRELEVLEDLYGVKATTGPAVAGVEGFRNALKALESASAAKNLDDVLAKLPRDAKGLRRLTDAEVDALGTAIDESRGLKDHSGAVGRLPDSAKSFLARLGMDADKAGPGFADGLRSLRKAAPRRAVEESAEEASLRKELAGIKSRRAKGSGPKTVDDSPEVDPAPRKKRGGIRGAAENILKHGVAYKIAGNLPGGIGRAAAYRAGLMAAGAGLAFAHPEEGAAAAAFLGLRGRVGARLRSALAKYGHGAAKVVARAPAPLLAILEENALGDQGVPAKDLREAVVARVQELDSLAPRAEDVAYAATTEIREESEMLGRAMQEMIARATRYLSEVAPRDPGTVIVAGKNRWKPSHIAARDFAERYWATVLPMDALDAFVAGTVSPAAVHALANAWPEIYTAGVTIAQSILPGILPKMTRQERSRFTYLTGIQTDSSQSPGFVAFIQQQFMSAHQTGPGAVPPPGAQPGRPSSPAAPQPVTAGQRVTE